MKPAQRQAAEGILFSDACQLSMAHLYNRVGLHEKLAQFDHFFREYPSYIQHESWFCHNAGLEWLLNHLNHPILLRHPTEQTTFPTLLRDQISSGEPLLEPVLEEGELNYEPPPIELLRPRRQADLDRLHSGVKRLMRPHIHHVSLTECLRQPKQELSASAH